MSQIYISNGQTDKALTHIRYRNVLSNSHKKSLEDNSETFDFTTHADKSFSQFIDGNNRVIIHGEDNNFLEFIIYEVQEDRIKKELEIYSYASYAELITAKSIRPHKTDALTAEAHGNLALAGTEWEMGNVEFEGVRTITFENYTNPYAYLKRIASVFDLELDFRIEHDNGNITGRYVDLVEKVGQWRGRRVEFGKDLIGLKRIVNTENIVTALRVIGPVREDGSRLEVIVEDEEALQRWGRNGQHIIKEYEPQFEDIDNATIARLRELGEQELAKRVNAIVSYEGTIADLENVPGMENKKIRFGDTIQIKDTSYEPALYLDARIFFQDRDIKEQAEKIVYLGDFTEYTEEEVHSIWQILQKQINEKIGRLELEQYAEPVIPEQDTPPSNPKKGDKWVDTSENPPQLKLFDGNEWHAVKGEKGDRGEPGKDGYTPIKGVDYFDGKDGQDGTSSYLWVRYSQNADGNPMSPDPTNAKYIGVATTETPSAPTSPSAYEWSLIKGSDGIPGEDGSDGRTSYLHIKYSNDGGQTFTGNNGEDVGEWIGTYVDFTQADSNNVNDYTWNKVKGEKGDKGDTGPRGATGERGPRGDAGTSVTGVTEYYLASSASSGVTTGTSGWTTSMQQMTPSKRYLWNYEKIHFSDDTSQNTLPVIIGVYGDKGDEGDTGRSIVSIEERYLATSASSGVTRSTSGWTSNMQQTTTSKRYLWNYEIITWNKAPLTTYIEPIIIGVHGETGPKGDKGDQGPQGIQGPKGEDGQSQYVHIRYSANANGNPMTTTPQSNSKYIGLANTTSQTAPSSYTAYTWSLIRGADGQDGIPGPKGDDGQTTYTWVRYADDENGSGMSDSPHDKLYIGLAFNKTTPTESNNPSDYTWSLMPQNIDLGDASTIAYFDGGTSSFLSIPNRSTYSDFSIITKVYVEELGSTRGIFGGGASSPGHLEITPSGQLRTRFGVIDVITTSGVIKEKDWYRIEVTLNSSDNRLRAIVNGDEVINRIVTHNPLNLTSGARLGTSFTGTGRKFKGYIVGLSLWSKALSDEELSLYNKAEPTKDDDGLISYYRLTGMSFQDVNGRHATNAGTVKWGSTSGLMYEDVQADIDEAKGIAEQAQQSADGKNTVYRQSSTPPTTNRKTGDIWFKTNEGNKMYVWTGSWTETKLDYQALAVGKLSAISADLGNVTSGKMTAVEVEGVTGTFGKVSVTDGDFTLKDSVTESETIINTGSNIIYDHSFELIKPDTAIEPIDPTNPYIASITSVDPDSFEDFFGRWNNSNPSQARMVRSYDAESSHIYAGLNSIILRGQSYGMWDQICYIPEQVRQTNTLSLSCYVAPFAKTTSDVTVSLRLQLVSPTGSWIQDLASTNHVIDHTKKYNWQRVAVTYKGSLNLGGNRIRVRLLLNNNVSNAMLLCDGVQLVPFEHPTLYESENSLYQFMNGIGEAPQIVADNIAVTEYATIHDSWIGTTFIGNMIPHAEGFLSVQNGWASYGGSFQRPRYTKTASGVVILSGMFRDGAMGTTMATLPAGCRPGSIEVFSVATAGSSTGRVYIYNDGRIIPERGNNAYISISGISFLAEN